jgi:hypothetical protein
MLARPQLHQNSYGPHPPKDLIKRPVSTREEITAVGAHLISRFLAVVPGARLLVQVCSVPTCVVSWSCLSVQLDAQT